MIGWWKIFMQSLIIIKAFSDCDIYLEIKFKKNNDIIILENSHMFF